MIQEEGSEWYVRFVQTPVQKQEITYEQAVESFEKACKQEAVFEQESE